MAFLLAHMADLHLSARPARGEWTARRALGYANWLVRRRRRHPAQRLHDAVEAAAGRALDAVLISGDIGQLGLAAEYAAARAALAPFTRRGVPVLMVGGNHDHYGLGRDERPIPAWEKLCRDLLLDVRVDEHGVARVPNRHGAGHDGPDDPGAPDAPGGHVEVLLCHQGRAGGFFGSWGEVTPATTAAITRAWRWPSDIDADAAHAPIRLALGHYPLRTALGRPLPAFYGLRGAEAWPSLLDACGVRGYFCGHLHRKFALDLTAGCRQFCAGSVTAGAGADLYALQGGRVVAA